MLTDTFKVIDTDTHAIEPYDLWTSRISTAKWGDKVPHVKWDPDAKADAWYFGPRRIWAASGSAFAGWHKGLPSYPPTLKDAQTYTWDAHARLKLMDEHGIYAQILYPNVAGFGGGNYKYQDDPELMLLCVQAYNDWLTEWSSAAPKRLIPQMVLPFWDIDLCIKEMARAAKLGHTGIVMCGEPEYFDMPVLTDPRWDPFWAAAQDMDLPINFHVGSGDFAPMKLVHASKGINAGLIAAGVVFHVNNASQMGQIIGGGICHNFPRLKFVSVESGIGWIPYALASMDWQWKNSNPRDDHPEWDLLPSEYFKRQFYGCFWHEIDTLPSSIELLGADNVLFETDFPHPASQSPGPSTPALNPKDYIEKVLGKAPRDVSEKILHSNAAKLYHLS